MNQENEFDTYVLKALGSSKSDIDKSLFVAMTANWDSKELNLIAYTKEPTTEEQLDLLDDMEVYFLSHMPFDYKTNFEVKYLSPREKPENIGIWL